MRLISTIARKPDPELPPELSGRDHATRRVGTQEKERQTRKRSRKETSLDTIRKLIVEFIGPFALVYIGAGAIIATGGKDLVAIALAHGLAIGLLVAAAGHISGGVYNPALTAGLMAARRLSIPMGIGYIIAQLLGGTVAAALLKLSFSPQAVDAVKLGTPLLGTGVTAGQGVLVELILTFFLMFSVFGTAVDPRGPRTIAGPVIGLIITMDIFAGGALTGAAMNPARSFGPELIQGVWDAWWVYWVGPILGAVIAALLYNEILLEEPKAAPSRSKA
ncbi:MAG: aquaporin [Chloroflexi bacterium]|nr:aquaporin [Chloroflexota bacterium]